MEDKEKYSRSGRIIRYMILCCLGLAAAALAISSLCLSAGNQRLRTEADTLSAENEELEETLEELELQLSELQTEETESGEDDGEGSAVSSEEDEDAWMLLLVNETHPLDQDYEVELSTVSSGQKVDSRILDPLNEMLSAMYQEGLRPLVCSGYRTVEKQSTLFEEYIEERLAEGWTYEAAFYKAKTRIALPGTSEHQTGLAVDIVATYHQSLDDAQAETDEAIWLAQHCQEYGFILRYPEDKIDITGIDYEAWHFRYVGEEAAVYIMENGITLEEYLEIADI